MPKVVITDAKGLVQKTGKGLEHKYTPLKVRLVTANANDTTITSLNSGEDVYFGTATGIIGAADDNNAYTFKLPVAAMAGERIRVRPVNAAAYGSLLGFVCSKPATEHIRYVAYEASAVVESSTTVVGVNGTANTMVKVAATHFQIGDIYELTSLSTTQWLLEIHGGNGLIAGGDIAPDPGNAAGYID